LLYSTIGLGLPSKEYRVNRKHFRKVLKDTPYNRRRLTGISPSILDIFAYEEVAG